MDLQTLVINASRAYKMYARRLEKLNIFKLEDFLFHAPSRYENFSLISSVRQVQPGELVTIQGKVEEIKNDYTRNHRTLQKAKVQDDSGTIDVLWFNQPFLTRIIKQGDYVSLSGKAELNKNKIVLISPDYEVKYDGMKETIHTGRLVPIYPETKGVSSKWLRRQIYNLIENHLEDLTEYLPQDVIKNNSLLEFKQAVKELHFPSNLEAAQKARERLAFDELFLIQVTSLVRKKEWQKDLLGNPFLINDYLEKIEKLKQNLPFKLTTAQEKVIKEIFTDLASKKPMNRLLEGEVGSGKTVVAAFAIYLSYLNGFQSVLMAPTEILATQHYKTLHDLLSPLGIKVELKTGANKKISDDFNVLVGTHALLYDKKSFKNLSLVIIDEQQRFGVEQRAIIRKKGKNPHILTMTATPIPRTVALTMYGDLDLSFLDEMPSNRKRVKTWLVPPEKRQSAYKWIEKEIMENKSQAFIICPFIEPSENMETVRAATKEFERLNKEIFPKLKLGLLHGKLKSSEKDKILAMFKDKEIDILVSTPVVEVGIDIPNATIMLIEGSERFGLAQLHQLRGRVGRGDKQSYCLLFTDSPNPLTIRRLKSLETIYFGPELAELDLKLRGPGQIYGTAQHGVIALKIAHFSDFDLIDKTKKAAEKIIDSLDELPLLKEKVKNVSSQEIAPD